MDKYVITGISRLTGERVVVSNTHSLSEAVEIRDRMAGKLLTIRLIKSSR